MAKKDQQNMEGGIDAVVKNTTDGNRIAEANLHQNIKNGASNTKGQEKIAESITDLKPVFESFSKGASFIEALLAHLKGEKGDDGKTPEKGKDYFTKEEKQEFIKTILDRSTPERGVDYFTDEDINDLMEDLISVMKEMVPSLTEEKLNKSKGLMSEILEDMSPKILRSLRSDLRDMREEIFERLLKKIPAPKPGKPGAPGKPGKDGSPDTGQKIVSKLSRLKYEDRLSYLKLKNRPNVITAMRDLTDVDFGNTLPTTIKSVIFDPETGKIVFGTAPSGGGFTKLEKTSGTINDANTTFGFDSEPTYLVIRGNWYDNVNGGEYTWTWNGSEVELNLPIGDGGRIWGFA